MRNEVKKSTDEVVWQAPEHIDHERDAKWFVAATIIILALFGIALLFGNFLFAIFIVIAGILIFTLGNKEPETYKFRINNEGVAIGEEIFHDYDGLESFGIIKHEHKLDEVVIKKQRILMPFIKMPIDSRTLPKAKRILKKKLPEEEYYESIVDTIADILKI